jgi:hypothetical protein
MRRYALMAVVILVSGCAVQAFQGVPGSGIVKQETREVGDFTSVDVGGAFQAKVRVGTKVPIVLKGDENLLPLVTTEVRGNQLVVGVKLGTKLRPSQPITIEITTPTLDGVAASGASKVDVEAARAEHFAIDSSGAAMLDVRGIDADDLKIDLSGAVGVKLAGTAKTVSLDVSGASNLKAGGLAAERVKVGISGASGVELIAHSAVEGDVSGASHLTVAGNPGTAAVKSSGASSVTYHAAAKRQ